MGRSYFVRLLRLAARGLAAIAALGALYLLAALAGALLRPGTVAPETGQTYPIVLVWSDIHTDLILPGQGLSVDWRSVLGSENTPPALLESSHFAFGWGSESFYTNAPGMADITPQLIAKAMFFDTTVVHVTPVEDPPRIPPQYRATFWVSAAAMTALEQFVLGSFALAPDGRAEALPGKTYGYSDAFYHAHGRYNPIRTCNQWTSEGLRLAGVSAGYWTPFSESLIWVLGTDAASASQ